MTERPTAQTWEQNQETDLGYLLMGMVFKLYIYNIKICKSYDIYIYICIITRVEYLTQESQNRYNIDLYGYIYIEIHKNT